MRALVLSVDQGTTGSRAFLFSEDGRVISQAYREFRQYYPKPGWVEHDPAEILESVRYVVQKAVRNKNLWKKIGAIGITNQRETLVMWDERTGKPVHRAIVWQCRRTADLCSTFRKRGLEAPIGSRTGLRLDPYFSGTKVRWLIENVPGLKSRVMRGNICFGTIDSWLLWNFSSGIHATDFTNASRTLLFNIRTRHWDPDLMGALGIPKTLRMPNVRKSAGPFGSTRGFRPIPDGIPITGICGDQQAALFGQGAVSPGEIKNTYGTGCFLMLHTGNRCATPKQGLLSTLACDASGGPAYALEGSVFIAGAAVQWLRDGLRVIERSTDSERVARKVPDTGGVVVVPAFTGLGAPHWNPDARGAIFGLTRGTTRAHIIRATLEAIAFQTHDVFEAMRRAGTAGSAAVRVRQLRVDGGASQNDFLMQFQADLLGIPVIRPRHTEITAWGAAKLAGIGAGIWKNLSKSNFLDGATVFRPRQSRAAIQPLIERWKSFVQRLL